MSVHQTNYNLWREAQDTLWDLGNLVWCTYGTTSTVGRNAEKVAQLWGYLHPRIEDVAYAEGIYRIEQRPVDTPEVHHFEFDWRRRSNMGHKLRRRLPLGLHQQIAKEFSTICVLYEQFVTRYTLKTSERWTFKHLSRALASLRSSLSQLFSLEFPVHPNIYGLLPKATTTRSPLLDHMDKMEAAISWPVSPKTVAQALEAIRSLQEQESLLTVAGYGYPWTLGATSASHRTSFQKSRSEMLGEDFAQQFIHCCAWLDRAKVVKTPQLNSYWLKHIVERLVGTYISNGAMVTAGIHKRIPSTPEGINLLFGLSKKWAKEQDSLSHRVEEEENSN